MNRKYYDKIIFELSRPGRQILAAAGDYTLSEKEPLLQCGTFPAWFSENCGAPAYEIAPGKRVRISDAADLDALYKEVEEMLVLAGLV